MKQKKGKDLIENFPFFDEWENFVWSRHLAKTVKSFFHHHTLLLFIPTNTIILNLLHLKQKNLPLLLPTCEEKQIIFSVLACVLSNNLIQLKELLLERQVALLFEQIVLV